jgi:hypothetical protein
MRVGHCRRRKIRCLLAADGPAGRCSNCIRLKKECIFYQVKRNPHLPHVPTMSSTPAAIVHRHDGSDGNYCTPFFGPASNGQPPSFGYHGEHESDRHQVPVDGRMYSAISVLQTLTNKVPVQHLSYPYPPPIETQWPSANGFLPSSTVAESPSWRNSPSTANSSYCSESNVSGGQTPAAMSTSSTMSYGHQDSHWGQQPPFQPPTRSIRYGLIEGLPQQYSGEGLGIQHENYRRTSPYPYPTTIKTDSSTKHATVVGGRVPNNGPPMLPTGGSLGAQCYAEWRYLNWVPL